MAFVSAASSAFSSTLLAAFAFVLLVDDTHLPNAFFLFAFVPYCVLNASTPFDWRSALQYFAAFLKSVGAGSEANAAPCRATLRLYRMTDAALGVHPTPDSSPAQRPPGNAIGARARDWGPHSFRHCEDAHALRSLVPPEGGARSSVQIQTAT